jgi:CheY-like chemotaxis protein
MFDCILLDYNLQTECGLGVLDVLKSKCDAPPPVVMLTGNENLPDEANPAACGAACRARKGNGTA